MGPAPICRPSSDLVGGISAAVPVRNASSAVYTSYRLIGSSRAGIPASAASSSTMSRVTPRSTPVQAGGVVTIPRRTMKTFIPDASAT